MTLRSTGIAALTVLASTMLGAGTSSRSDLPKAGGPTVSEQEIDAKRLYERECASCHGKQGRGNGRAGRDMDPRPTDITAPDYLLENDDAYLLEVVARGDGEMPGMADDYDEAQMVAIVAYVRVLGEQRNR